MKCFKYPFRNPEPRPKRHHIIIFTILISSISLLGVSQGLPIGQRSLTFTDPLRNNRPVPVEVYYPATAQGLNMPVASGVFPVVVFGHGYQMTYEAYLYFRDALVPQGYVLVYPKTESSLFPSHQEFGNDLAFLVLRMQTEGASAGSPFFGHIDSTSAVMGHSMGGGASFLACRNNVVPTVMVTWAAAETNPSAITAAGQITIPSLVLAADKDCVTPPATNQLPMYQALASACKFYVNIKGGGHCYFADPNTICQLGEIGCPPFTINREQQHAVVLDFTIPYLDHYLKGIPGAWTAFLDSLETSPRITSQKSCITSSYPEPGGEKSFRITPNPVTQHLLITGPSTGLSSPGCLLSDICGKIRHVEFQPVETNSGTTILADCSKLDPGIYFISIPTLNGRVVLRMIRH